MGTLIKWRTLTWIAIILCAQFARAGQPPNIIMIISDDHAWTDYGFMGHRYIETPNLDHLARRSALFQRGYVPTALCRPSLATLLTGKYAHQHRITGNDPALLPSMTGPNASREEPDAYRQLRGQLISLVDQQETLPELLATRGYVSFQSGKWWEGSFHRGGFTEGMTRGFPEPGGRHGDDGLKIGRDGMQPITEFIDRAVAAEKPFFVWYAPLLPHTPHNPPQRLFDKYKAKGVESDHVARYYAMVEWLDETCGELLQHLDRKQISDNTLIVYIADNGWIQRKDSADSALRSKQSPHEGGVRQPILFSLPGKIRPGNRDDQLCSSVDIVPTLLDAAGVAPPKDLPGYDLMPCLTSGDPTRRNKIFGESFSHDIVDMQHPEATLLYRWVIEDRWKLILTYDGAIGRSARFHARDDVRPQLYDLIADPSETTNLASKHPDLVKKLGDDLRAWWPVTKRRAQTQFAD